MRNPPSAQLFLSIHITLQAMKLSVEYTALYFKGPKPKKAKARFKNNLKKQLLNSKTVDNISF